jgi:hypothetical protein
MVCVDFSLTNDGVRKVAKTLQSKWKKHPKKKIALNPQMFLLVTAK